MDATSILLRSEFWKSHLLLPETPRSGDLAAIVQDHQCGPLARETGALVKVVNAPVFGTVYCEHCGQRVDAWVVEVEPRDEIGAPMPGEYVHAYPVKWLQRVLPLGHTDASQKQVLITA